MKTLVKVIVIMFEQYIVKNFKEEIEFNNFFDAFTANFLKSFSSIEKVKFLLLRNYPKIS